MIKEFNYQLANTKTGFKFESAILKSSLISPIVNKISLENEVSYLKTHFDVLKILEIKIENKNLSADIIPIYLWSKFFCVSKKFKDIFQNKLKGSWYSTNYSDYFIFLLDNCINGLDKEKATIKYNEKFLNKPYRYEYIENELFKSEIVKNEYLFTIPELYGTYLSTEKFETLYRENNLTGLQFFKNLNFKRKDGSVFDAFRRKKYDEEGNCLGE